MSTDFGKRLKAARKHAGLTQKQLAPLVPMSQSNLSELETVAYGSTFVPQLARVCGVNAHWLATGEGEMLGEAEQERPPPQSSLGSCLEVIGMHLPMVPNHLRAELADAFRAWVVYGGRDVYRTAIEHLLAGEHKIDRAVGAK